MVNSYLLWSMIRRPPRSPPADTLLPYTTHVRSYARFVVVEELLTLGAPVAAHWIADRQSAPLILNFGSEEQRRHYLPRICRGEIFFCIGMSEPGSGSDLASVRPRADRTASGSPLHAQKNWTTNPAPPTPKTPP